MKGEHNPSGADVDGVASAPRRLRRAEAVLAQRCTRLILVLERAWNDENVQATLRTAEAFGVQRVWSIRHPHGRRRAQRSVTRGSHAWLDVRMFESTGECLAALREEGCAIWVSDLSPEADVVTQPSVLQPVPETLALVIGREVGGVSAELIEAADRRLYLPMHGFTESFNLSVAAALLLQRLFDADPSLRGPSDQERRALREVWYERLAKQDPDKLREYRSWLVRPPQPLDETRPAEEHRRPRIKKRDLHLSEEPGDAHDM